MYFCPFFPFYEAQAKESATATNRKKGDENGKSAQEIRKSAQLFVFLIELHYFCS